MKKYFFHCSFLVLILAVLSAFSLPAHAEVWSGPPDDSFNQPQGIAVGEMETSMWLTRATTGYWLLATLKELEMEDRLLCTWPST